MSASLAGAQSYIPTTRLLKSKGYQIGASADYFSTSKVVDANGKKMSLPDGASFSRLQGEVSGYYGATDDLQFGVGLRYRQNQFGYEDTAGDKQTATGTGLESTYLSIMFAFPQVDQMQYTLEGTFRYRPYTNEEFDPAVDDPNKLILGDQGNEISGGLGVTYFAKNNNFLTLRAGYRRAGSDISDEIYWQAEGAMAWRYVALIAGVDGVNSMNSDPYEDAPSERPVFNTGTNLYYGENREWITPYAGINFALGDTWRLELRGSQVVSGKATDLGTTFGINLVRRVDKNANRQMDSRFKSYDLEASVTKVSPKKAYVVIDKGLADDVAKGMRFDFFEFDYVGGNVLVATGVVIQVKSETAIVKLTNRYNTKKDIKEGLIARATLK